MTAPLDHKARICAELQDRLAMADEAEDVDVVALELATADLESSCIAALRAAKTCEAMADGIKSIIADNRARKERLERRADAIRAHVAWAMTEAASPKLTAPDMTVSLRQNKPSVVTTIEPDDAPEEFVRAKVTYSFDNDAIRDALDAGQSLEWAHFGNPSYAISVRTK